MIGEFNQIYNAQYVTEFANRITILERETSATISTTHFLYDKFFTISVDILAHFNAIFSSNKLIDDNGYGVNCDGAFLVKKNDKWYLCLCELKSKFSIRTFVKSKLQLEVTYLKLIKLLRVLKSFDSENFDCVFFIVSQKPDLNQVQVRMEQLRERNTYSPAHIAFQGLVNNDMTQITNDCCRLGQEPIKSEYTTANHFIHFIDGNNIETELNPYLN
jgi:hypothetical protein